MIFSSRILPSFPLERNQRLLEPPSQGQNMREEIQVKFAKLDANAQLPTQGSSQAAGWDLYALEETIVLKGSSVMIPTGLACAIPEGWEGLDAGPKTLAQFAEVIAQSKTILWNGPVGVFEIETFAKGTIAIGEAISKATAAGAFSLVGGGDSVAAVKEFGFEDKVSYVSTGGGAMLESLEGKTLPGIAAIEAMA